MNKKYNCYDESHLCDKYKNEGYQCSCKQDFSCLFDRLVVIQFFIKQLPLIIDIQNYLYRWVCLVH